LKIAVCPGSFDPVTLGHIDIIRRSAGIFDKVIVVVMGNSSKHPMFSQEERVEMIRRATTDISGVEVEYYNGLLVEFARDHGAAVIVKGLRAMSDFEYEFQMALTNRRLNPDLETVFLNTTAEYMFLSSSLVKQVGILGGDFGGFVPQCIEEDIRKKINIIRNDTKGKGMDVK